MRLSFMSLFGLLSLGLFLYGVSGDTYCDTGSNVTFGNIASLTPQLGNANQLKNGDLKLPWPRVGDFHIVRYCYANVMSALKLRCLLQKAIGIWSDALGYDGAKSEHSIRWKQMQRFIKETNLFMPKYCYDEHGRWDPTIDGDVLEVRYEEGKGPFATVDYVPEEWDNLTGRNFMVLPGEIEPHRVAHELGHVLGMVHEQCRGDRYQFVEVRCEKIRCFTHALTSAILDGESPHVAKEKLCKDKATAKKYRFDAAEYIKNDEVPRIDFIMDEGSFDYGSIMLYPSNTFVAGDCQNNLDECPMVAIDRVDGEVVGTRPININAAPSTGDVAFVRKYYPWIEPVPGQDSSSNTVCMNKTYEGSSTHNY
ncbi:hypothetical protein NX059_000133 [Plenodomus lindquistii]|nr:hypothetical protein NX059_000133 [Plenodomus lindquistii]